MTQTMTGTPLTFPSSLLPPLFPAFSSFPSRPDAAAPDLLLPLSSSLSSLSSSLSLFGRPSMSMGSQPLPPAPPPPPSLEPRLLPLFPFALFSSASSSSSYSSPSLSSRLSSSDPSLIPLQLPSLLYASPRPLPSRPPAQDVSRSSSLPPSSPLSSWCNTPSSPSPSAPPYPSPATPSYTSHKPPSPSSHPTLPSSSSSSGVLRPHSFSSPLSSRGLSLRPPSRCRPWGKPRATN